MKLKLIIPTISVLALVGIYAVLRPQQEDRPAVGLGVEKPSPAKTTIGTTVSAAESTSVLTQPQTEVSEPEEPAPSSPRAPQADRDARPAIAQEPPKQPGVSMQRPTGVPFSGRIVDANGSPRKGIMISLPAGGTQTGADGSFRFDNFGPMLGKGRDRGKFTILVPGKSWYVKQNIQNLDVGGEKAVALGDITVPESIASTGIKGRVEGDESLFPRTLRMVSEDGSIEALVAVRRDGVFGGNDYPAGSYILSNTTVAGTPNPKTAQRQTYKVSLTQGQTTDLVFAVSKAPASQER